MKGPRGADPLWLGTITSAIFFVILAVPIVAAVWFGLRANRAGTRWGWAPIALAALAALYLVGITIINLGAQLLGIEVP